MVGLFIGLLFALSTLAYMARGIPRTIPDGQFSGETVGVVRSLGDTYLVPVGTNTQGLDVSGTFGGYYVIQGDENVLATLIERNAPVIYRSATVEANVTLGDISMDMNLPAYVLYTRKPGDLIPISYFISVYGGRVERAVVFDTIFPQGG